MKNTIEISRVEADVTQGLSSEQVNARVAAKLTNKTKKVVGKSYLQIFFSNIFTFFNFLGLFIFFLMVLCKSTSNMLGLIIVLANSAIGIFQEVRSKLAVEKLSIVNEANATVIRNGAEQAVAVCDVVRDDILVLSAGNQICCDSTIAEGVVEVNESMLTGESDVVSKKAGDKLFSGSYVVSGNCKARCDKVGKDNYVETLSARVKRAKMPDSQLMKGIRLIIRTIAFVVFPLGLATFLCSSQMKFCYGLNVNIIELYLTNAPDLFVYDGASVTIREIVNKAIISASGSMLGMIPSGMVLLTSVALAVAALKLARKNVLVRELPCIEMLARVDTLCLDKTGTITDGSMSVEHIIAFSDFDENQLRTMLQGVVSATGDDNATARALKNFLEGCQAPRASAYVPFSSERKLSAAVLDDVGVVAVGAAEFMFGSADKDFEKQCGTFLAQGLRVLAIGFAKTQNLDDGLANLRPVGILALQDTVREDASGIIGWFSDNNVDIKIISGDNPLSVSVIAQKVGVKNAEKFVSLEGMTDEEVAKIANSYTVFGRVTPEQKAVLVRAMKAAGHTVAMTGDGVNDILAMRESDCAISVGCGTDAAKTVANLVLSDSKFGSMPNVVAQGRQVVNNIQNSSSLFIMKTCMVMLTTVLCLALQVNFPFAPNQLYPFEFFIDGLPSFFLALKPNRNLIKGNFLANTFRSTLPGGVAMFFSVAMCFAFSGTLGIDMNSAELSTVAMFSMTATGVVSLLILLCPYDKINVAIALFASGGAAASFFLFPWIFDVLHSVFPQSETPSPMYVAVDSGCVLFIVINCVAMGVLIVAIKLALKFFGAKKAVCKNK